MSDNVLIVLIIAVTVIAVLFLFRRQLSAFLFKAGKDGLEAELKVHDPSESNKEGDSHKVQISRNKLIGKENEIKVAQNNVGVDDNLLLGEKQKIEVEPAPGKEKKKKK